MIHQQRTLKYQVLKELRSLSHLSLVKGRGNHCLMMFYSVARFYLQDSCVRRRLGQLYCVHNMAVDRPREQNQTSPCLSAELNEVWCHLSLALSCFLSLQLSLSLSLLLSIPLLANVSKALSISRSWRALKGDV